MFITTLLKNLFNTGMASRLWTLIAIRIELLTLMTMLSGPWQIQPRNILSRRASWFDTRAKIVISEESTFFFFFFWGGTFQYEEKYLGIQFNVNLKALMSCMRSNYNGILIILMRWVFAKYIKYWTSYLSHWCFIV